MCQRQGASGRPCESGGAGSCTRSSWRAGARGWLVRPDFRCAALMYRCSDNAGRSTAPWLRPSPTPYSRLPRACFGAKVTEACATLGFVRRHRHFDRMLSAAGLHPSCAAPSFVTRLFVARCGSRPLGPQRTRSPAHPNDPQQPLETAALTVEVPRLRANEVRHKSPRSVVRRTR